MGIIPTMSSSSQKIYTAYILLIFLLGSVACGQEISTTIPTLPATRDISPYFTSAVRTLSPTPGITTFLTDTPDPTATPFIHVIEKGDTMLGIAIRYGIKLENLQAANPDVNPNILTVGSQLIIPLVEDLQNIVLTPTPIPIVLEPPNCYRTADQGAWCFVLIENHYSYALENVSARFVLYSNQDDDRAVETAFSPLNRIEAGKRMPLMFFFSPPIPAEFYSETELLTAVAIEENSPRYVNGLVDIDEVNIHSNGLTATVHGSLNFLESMEYPGLVWLLAIAYGEDDEVVGVRKWEAVFPRDDPAPLITGTPETITMVSPVSLLPVTFDMEVYSLGPPIKQVEVILEAYP